MEGTIDVYNNVKEEGSITVDSNWINKFLGTEISKEEMKEALGLSDDQVIEVTRYCYKRRHC